MAVLVFTKSVDNMFLFQILSFPLIQLLFLLLISVWAGRDPTSAVAEVAMELASPAGL